MTDTPPAFTGEIHPLADAFPMLPDDDLDGAVAAMAAQIVGNSWDTSRFDKAILADQRDMTRSERLAYERTSPYGRPRDMAERLANPR